MRHRWRVRAAVAIAVMSASAPLYAQGGFVEPSPEQIAQNTKAIKAVKAGDFNKAIELFEGSLEFGELNITYLNLGRTYQRAGRCVDAARTFDKVTRAPKVALPNPSQVASKVSAYRNELNKQCPGRLTLACTPTEGVTITIDESRPLPCEEARNLPLTPGEHVIVATFAEQRQKRTVRVPVDTPITETIHIEGLPTPEPDDPIVSPPKPPVDPGERDNTTAYILLASGSAAVIVGVVLDLALADGVRGEGLSGGNALKAFTPIGLYTAGGAVALWGLLKLL